MEAQKHARQEENSKNYFVELELVRELFWELRFNITSMRAQ